MLNLLAGDDGFLTSSRNVSLNDLNDVRTMIFVNVGNMVSSPEIIHAYDGLGQHFKCTLVWTMVWNSSDQRVASRVVYR